MSGNKKYLIWILVLILLILIEITIYPLLKERIRTKEIKSSLSQLKKSPELITVKYQVDSLYCIDGRRGRINIFGINLWEIEHCACWKVRSEVIAGYNWDEISWEKKRDRIVLKAPAPKIIGINYKKGKLIYAKNWQELGLSEKDFIQQIRKEAKENALKLGILEDAISQLNILAKILERKTGLKIELNLAQSIPAHP